MKLLLSTCACTPFGGSEGIYGWYVVSALAKEHECFVLTSKRHQPSIEKAAEKGMIPSSLHFRYIGTDKPWPGNRLRARILSWLDYRKFSEASLGAAREWHQEIGFDLAQLVTYTTWRVPSPLWRLGIPFIWGPISGTEVFPSVCFSSLSFQAKTFELMRNIQTGLAKRNRAVRDCAAEAFHIPVPHRQAVDFLSNLRRKPGGVALCHNFFFPTERMDWLFRERPPVDRAKPLRAFGAGNLEGRKGVSIALRAIALAKEKGVRVEYHVTSRGPELAYLQKLSTGLAIDDRVILGEKFEEGDFAAALATFDVCLLPSLRDGAGLSIMEAMLAGCVPIVADWCGPAEFVTSQCGFKVPVARPDRMAADICEILLALDKDREKARQLGQAARERIREAYNEKQFLDTMSDIYGSAQVGGSTSRQ